MPDNYTEIFTEGLFIKNYREFCSLLGWKPTTGESKKSQFRMIDRYLDYERIGNAFVITLVKETPDEIVDGRESNGSESIYGEFLEKILYTMLINNKEKTLTTSRVGWLNILGMVNSQFVKCNTSETEINSIADILKINKREVEDFVEKISTNLWASFERVLLKLEKESIITQQNTLIYWYKPLSINENKFVEYKNYCSTSNEYSEYKKIEKDELNSRGIKDERELYQKYSHQVNQVRKVISNKVNKHFGWHGHYKAKTISLDTKQVRKINEISNIQDEILKLNEKVIFRNTQIAHNRHENSIKRVLIYNLDPESLELISYSPERYSSELDEEQSYIKYKMAHYYAKETYLTNHNALLNRLIKYNK